MIRKLLLPALAIGLLGGCVSSGYQYDSAGYYYGNPSTNYRYDGYYDSRYRYPNSYPGTYGSVYYGSGSRYPGYGYGGGYRYGYGGGYYRPPVVVVRPGYGNHGNRPRPPSSGGRNDRAPWRDYQRLQRERIQQSTPPPSGNRPSSTVLRNPTPVQPRPAGTTSRPVSPPPSQNRRSSPPPRRSSPTPSQGSRKSPTPSRKIQRARTSRQVE